MTKRKDTQSNSVSSVYDVSNPAFDADKLKVNEAKRHRKDEIIFQYLTNQTKVDNSYPC